MFCSHTVQYHPQLPLYFPGTMTLATPPPTPSATPYLQFQLDDIPTFMPHSGRLLTCRTPLPPTTPPPPHHPFPHPTAYGHAHPTHPRGGHLPHPLQSCSWTHLHVCLHPPPACPLPTGGPPPCLPPHPVRGHACGGVGFILLFAFTVPQRFVHFLVPTPLRLTACPLPTPRPQPLRGPAYRAFTYRGSCLTPLQHRGAFAALPHPLLPRCRLAPHPPPHT